MRKDYLIGGWGARIVFLGVFMLNNTLGHFNDMGEIIYYSLTNMLTGTNPYSVQYGLDWGVSTFVQPLNYGPIALIMYLPAMLLPFWYNSMWLGYFIMNNVYAYLISNYIMKHATFDKGLQKRSKNTNSEKDKRIEQLEPRVNRYLYYTGAALWLIPWGTFIVSSFLYLPILLVTIAFGNRDNPLKCGIYIAMASFSYQLALLMAPVYVVYNFKKGWKVFFEFVKGWIPVLLIVVIFVFWDGGGIIYSMFLYSGDMGYIKCPDCGNPYDITSVLSISQVAYQIGGYEIGNYLRFVLATLIVIIIAIYYFTDKYDENQEAFIQKFQIFIVIGFILVNNYGQTHYFLLLIIPGVYLTQINHPNFRKYIPIGMGISSWEEFEEFVKKYNQLPP